MSAAASEYELEVLPEFGAGYESEFEGDFESQQFFGALANLARRGAGWMTAPGSSQRRFALSLARQALNRGLPTLRQTFGASTADWLGGLLPQEEFEAELEGEFELNPIRRVYPDAMLEHLGHAAAATQSEAEAEALASAMIPLAAQLRPQAAPVLMRAAPGLVCGISGLVRGLRRSAATQPLVRVVPAIVRGTAASVARQAAGGASITPEAAVRMLAQQTLRVLGNPQQSARAFRRSRALDGLFHRSHRSPRRGGCNCPACAARQPVFDFEAPPPAPCRALTDAESRIARQARAEAIDLAKTAASKLDLALTPGPLPTKEAQAEAERIRGLFKSIFGHDPRRLLDPPSKVTSGASVAHRFRAVAEQLAERKIAFRVCRNCTAAEAGSNFCCDVAERAFTRTPTLPLTLCPPFWNPMPPQAGLPAEGFRGGVILHEMLHVLNPDFFGHDTMRPDGTIVRQNTSTGGERRRNNAHCYRAFALRARGYGQDNEALPGCTRLGPGPRPL
jgi:hypothetical protein